MISIAGPRPRACVVPRSSRSESGRTLRLSDLRSFWPSQQETRTWLSTSFPKFSDCGVFARSRAFASSWPDQRGLGDETFDKPSLMASPMIATGAFLVELARIAYLASGMRRAAETVPTVPLYLEDNLLRSLSCYRLRMLYQLICGAFVDALQWPVSLSPLSALGTMVQSVQFQAQRRCSRQNTSGTPRLSVSGGATVCSMRMWAPARRRRGGQRSRSRRCSHR